MGPIGLIGLRGTSRPKLRSRGCRPEVVELMIKNQFCLLTSSATILRARLVPLPDLGGYVEGG